MVMESLSPTHLQSRDFDPNTYPTVNWEVFFTLPPAEAEYQLAHVGQSWAGLMMALMYGEVALGSVAVLLRFSSRRISKTKLQADDWVIVAAWVCEGFSGFLFSVGAQERPLMGLGKPESDADAVVYCDCRFS